MDKPVHPRPTPSSPSATLTKDLERQKYLTDRVSLWAIPAFQNHALNAELRTKLSQLANIQPMVLPWQMIPSDGGYIVYIGFVAADAVDDGYIVFFPSSESKEMFEPRSQHVRKGGRVDVNYLHELEVKGMLDRRPMSAVCIAELDEVGQPMWKCGAGSGFEAQREKLYGVVEKVVREEEKKRR